MDPKKHIKKPAKSEIYCRLTLIDISNKIISHLHNSLAAVPITPSIINYSRESVSIKKTRISKFKI